MDIIGELPDLIYAIWIRASVNGKIILVSFKLTQTMMDYLYQIGKQYGIEWELDIPDKSNERVSFSIGSLVV